MAYVPGDNLDNNLNGTAGDDTIEAFGGNDIVNALAGADSVLAGDGNDSVNAGEGHDTVDGGAGNDTLLGGEGNDELSGGSEADTLHGDAGNDSLVGGAGNDSFQGGAGDDTLQGGLGNDTFQSGDVSGADLIEGGGDNDYIYNDYLGQNTIRGGDGDDQMYYNTGVLQDGGAGNDRIYYYLNDLAGQDVTIRGGEGNDFVQHSGYSTGNSLLIEGGDGNDTLYGTNAFGETIDGGADNDLIRGYNGSDSLLGGDGNDSIRGGNDSDTIEGGAGDDLLEGEAGDDLIDGGTDTSGSGGTGDIAEFDGNRDRYTIVDNGGGTIRVVDNVGSGGDDTVSNVEVLRFSDGDVDVSAITLGTVSSGTAGSDSLDGTAGDDIIDGRDGDDTINGLAQNDSLLGGLGADEINGNDGTDRLFGDAGEDTLDGGAGNDLLEGGDDNDDLIGDAGNDTLRGGAGDDSLVGGADADSLEGGAGNDTLQGGLGNDTFQGGDVSGNDLIEGGDGSDYIYNDYQGQNTIRGGDGDDQMYYNTGVLQDGGAGNDTIYYYLNDLAGQDVTIQGGTGNDFVQHSGYSTGNSLLIEGGDGNDTLSGTNNFGDTIDGGADDDSIRGYSGSDSLLGGTGNDTIFGGNDNDTIEGGDGDDSLQGDNGNDSILGGAGIDTLSGGSGDDTMDGGTAGGGGDVVTYSGPQSNYVITLGALGAATVQDTVGSEGTDTITDVSILRFSDGDVVIGNNPGTSFAGTPGADSFVGSSGDDTIAGAADNDTLIGEAGNDTISGDDGADTLQGGFGDDTLSGGADNDALYGDAGNDSLVGGAGNDSFQGGVGDDTLQGGLGNDTFQSGDVSGADLIEGGGDNDYIYNDYLGQNTIRGGDGDDQMYYNTGVLQDGGAGNDTIYYYLNDLAGQDVTIRGGTGNDNIQHTGYATANSLLIEGGDGNDSLYGTNAFGETIDGGADDDRIFGNSGGDSLLGGDGNDSIRGGNDSDTIEGGAGDDLLEGQNGDDLINGGTDTSGSGGTGDIAEFDGNRDRYTIVDNGGGTIRVVDNIGSGGDDTVSNVEVLRFSDGDVDVSTLVLGAVSAGTSGDDSLDGTPGDDIIDGLAGNDTINGLAGNDNLTGGIGDDEVNGGDGVDRLTGDAGADDLSGGAGNDVLDGGADNDTLDGGTGNDSLIGGTGDDSLVGGADADTLQGGAGNDTLQGGLGNDTFQGGDVSGNDLIEGGDGSDYIYNDYVGQNTIRGGDGDDQMYYNTGVLQDGGAGNDTIYYYLNDLAGQDVTIRGGEGNDQIVYSGYSSSNSLLIEGEAGNDSITGSNNVQETLLGGDGNDTIRGNHGDDEIDGGADDDTIDGGNGADSIRGGSGDDTIRGGLGDDTIDGGADTSASGGSGDVVVYSGNRGDYNVIGNSTGLTVTNLTGTGEGTDVLTNVERLRFSDGDVVVSSGLTGVNLIGSSADDNGQSGNPSALTGTILNDTIEGRAGDDLIVALDGRDSLLGEEGNDTIEAGAEDDTVDGGAGDDSITGGAGDDSLIGGGGTDVAVFSGNQADYTITGNLASTTVTDNNAADGDDGTDTLENIRVLRFADGDYVHNNAPTVADDSATTNEDTFVDIPLATILSNDSDADGDTLSVASVQNAVGGTAVLYATYVRFTPSANFNGAASFETVISDGFATSTSTVNVTVSAVNDNPVANNDTATTNEDTSVNIDVLANDSDVDGHTVSVSGANNGANGTTTVEADGSITYAPNANFSGSDGFSYFVSDGNGGTASAYVTVTVTSVNDAPVAGNDSASTAYDTAVNIDVLTNDSDVDGGDLEITGTGAASNGTVAVDDNGTAGDTTDDFLTYTPDEGFVGTDSFSYTVSDGNGGSDMATVSVTVGNPSGDIVADFDSDAEGWSTSGDATNFGFAATGGNPDGHIRADDQGTGDTWYFEASSAFLGDRSAYSGGTLSYDQRQSNTGSQFDAPDVVLSGNGMTLVLNVAPNPTTLFTSYSVFLDTRSDWRIDTLSGTVATQAQIDAVLGDLTGLSIRGEFRAGSDSGFLDNVVMALPAGNAAPVAVDDSATTDEDTQVNIAVLGNDSDPDLDPVSVSSATNGSNGTTTVEADGTITYTPNANFNGNDSFTYTVSDGNGGSDTATVNVTVNSVNDVPVALNDAGNTSSGNPVDVNLLANDSDVEGPVSVISNTNPANGTVSINALGVATYTPNAGFFGVDTFQYTIEDSDGATATATATVNVAQAGVSASATGSDAVVLEGDSGTTTVTYRVVRTASLSETITVDYTIVGNGFSPIDAGDVSGSFPVVGQVVFAPNQTEAFITIDVTGDTTPEAHETMRLTLVAAEDSMGDAINILDAQHLVTVQNDDGPLAGGGDGGADGQGNDGTGTPGDPNDGGTPGTGGNNGSSNSGSNNGTGTPTPTPPGPPTPPGGPDNPGNGDNKESDVWGDPHIISFDGLAWDFQAVGEFIATMGTDPADDFMVQMRFTPFRGSSTISSTGAVATEIDGIRVAIYRDDQIPDGGSINLLIDGVPTEIDPFAGPVNVGSNGGQVWFDGNNMYTVVLPSGEQIMAKVLNGYMNVCVFTDGTVHPDGSTIGILGNGDDNPNNDILLPDGTVLTNPSFTDIYGAYANAWRVDAGNTLFDYSAGEGTADVTDLNFPAGLMQISDFPADAIAAATAVVDDLGITNPHLRDAAILDILITGDPGNGESANGLAATPVMGSAPTAPPVVNGVSIAALTPFASEGDTGDTTTFQFTIFRTGDTSGALDVDWSVVPVDTDAADFGGSLPSGGTVSFAAGEDSAVISVEVSGDDVAEFNEVFRVAIELPPAATEVYLAQSVQAIIQNDDGPLPSTFQVYALERNVTEGTGTGNTVTFAVTRSNSTLEEDSVTLTISGGDADGADIDGGSFPAPQVVTFLPGEDVKIVTVQLAGDSTVEPDETLLATLSSPSGGTITVPVATAVIVNDDNSAPVAGDDTVSGDEDTAINGDVTGNDSDADGDSLTYSVGTGPANGSLSLSGTGSFTYTPDANFNGSDSFTYSVDDGNGGTDTATVSITVNPVNDAPIAVNDTQSIPSELQGVMDLLSNDSDPDGDVFWITAVTAASNGTVTINDNNTVGDPTDDYVTYVSNPGFSGPDSFSYTIRDASGATDTATMILTVVGGAPNTAPVAADDMFSVDYRTWTDLTVLANDSDLDGDTLSITGISNLVGATAVIDDNGTPGDTSDDVIRFRSDLGVFDQVVSFDYTISDGNGGTDTGTVQVTVGPAPGAYVLGDEFDNTNLHGFATDDTVRGDQGNDVIFGRAGNDLLRGGSGNDTLDGGEGNDTMTGNQGNDRLAGKGGRDFMNGGAGNDTLMGQGGDDVMNGGDDDDRLFGHVGNDVLRGGEGNDWLEGGDGADTLTGQDGNDTLHGQGGADTFVFDSADGSDRITGFEDGVDVLHLTDGGSYTLTHSGPNTHISYGATDIVVFNALLDAGDIVLV
ncbi:MAG: tandem-95 repeat protein [Pelagimonas sp.]|jgi:Ca2+-binding RTX toxin-like protein|nr:tandem-95 repeat protein [Pelagimonas sp.]